LAESDRPSSVVVLGDNGTGKSSIVDAIELSLRGQTHAARGNAAYAVVQSRANDMPAEAAVELSDGRQLRRTFRMNEETGAWTITSGGPAAGFQRTPLILRRSDILAFWQTPVETRQLVFLRSFRPGQEDVELPRDRLARLTRERSDAKQRRDGALRRLADVTGEDVRSIPSELKAFESWVNWKLHGWDPESQRPTKTLTAQQKLALERAREARNSVRKANSALKEAEEAGAQGSGVKGSLSEILAGSASERLSRRYNAVSPCSPLNNIQLRMGERTAASLEVLAELADGSLVRPDEVLSEANRDLLALLIFVAVVEAAVERGDAPILILDDVFQSVDGPVRLTVMDLLVAELSGWQFFLTTHDRLWREQVNSVLQRRGVPVRNMEITSWSFDGGPALRGGSVDLSAPLAAAMERGEPSSIASHAGLLLEEVADVLSSTFAVRVVRRAGDRYTLNDLWPGVAKKLKATEAATTAETVDRHIHLRNLLGAHPNAWARSASLSEATQFGRAVLELVEQLRCASCGRFVEPTPTVGQYICRCGSRKLGFRGESGTSSVGRDSTSPGHR
jgi:hypothetical protein